MISCTLAWVLALLLLPLIVLFWATESRPQRIRRWRSQGCTWATCAARYRVSPSTARRWASQ